jgi:flagellar hook-associated protein 1 FlgK
MSLFGILQSATQSLLNTQTAIGVVSENLGNQQTAGYVARQAIQEEVSPSAGGGSTIVDVQRQVDATLQATLLAQSSTNGRSAYLNGVYNGLEQLTGSANGTPLLSNAMQQFQQAWSAFQTAPEDSSAQDQVIASAQSLTQTVQTIANGIEQLQNQVQGQANTDVSTLNQALARIAADNVSYISTKANGQPTAAIEDDRDQAIAAIANLVPVKVSPNSDGSVSVLTPGGISMVQGAQASSFAFDATSDSIYATNDPKKTSLNQGFAGGQISAELDTLNTSAAATNSVSLDATIGASATSPAAPIATQIYDVNGTAHDATITLKKTGTDRWQASIDVAGDTNSPHLVTLTFSPGGTGKPPAGTLVGMTAANAGDTLPSPQTTGSAANLGLDLSFKNAGGTTLTQSVSLDLGTFGTTAPGLTQPAGKTLAVQSITQGGIGTGNGTDASIAPLEKLRQQLNAFASLFYAPPPDAPTAFQAAYNNAQQTGSTELNSDLFTISTSAGPGTERLGFQVNPALVAGTAVLKQSAASPVMSQLTANTLDFNTSGVQVSSGSYQNIADTIAAVQSAQATTISTQSQSASATLTATQALYDNKTGVNSDQQLSLLVQLQNSYNAAAKVISVIQSMAQALEQVIP